MERRSLRQRPQPRRVIALIIAVTIALMVPSRRKRTAGLAAQWQAFQQH
ncbi:hypothetical protein AB0N97_16235 [Streptomyces collinus]